MTNLSSITLKHRYTGMTMVTIFSSSFAYVHCTGKWLTEINAFVIHSKHKNNTSQHLWMNQATTIKNTHQLSLQLTSSSCPLRDLMNSRRTSDIPSSVASMSTTFWPDIRTPCSNTSHINIRQIFWKSYYIYSDISKETSAWGSFELAPFSKHLTPTFDNSLW